MTACSEVGTSYKLPSLLKAAIIPTVSPPHPPTLPPQKNRNAHAQSAHEHPTTAKGAKQEHVDVHPPKGVMGLEASGDARADRRRALNSGCVCHPAHRWHGSAANAVRATTACRAVSEFSLCIKWMSWFTTESESMVHRAAMEDAATLERIQAPKNDSCGRQKKQGGTRGRAQRNTGSYGRRRH